MKILLLIILSMFFADSCEISPNDIFVNCQISQKNFAYAGNITLSEVTDQISIGANDKAIIYINILNRDEYNLSSIDGFRAINKTVKIIPSFEPKTSQKLKVLAIRKSKLKFMDRKKLRAFNNLELLNLEGNDIEILPLHIFNYNTKLKMIVLNYNKIVIIYPTVFEPLKNLQRLEFVGNICYSGSAGTSSQIKELKQTVAAYCTMQSNDNDLRPIIANLSLKIQALESTSNSNFQIVIIILSSILIFLIISKIFKIFHSTKSANDSFDQVELYKTPFQHQSSYEFPPHQRTIPKRQMSLLMNRNNSLKMSKIYFDDSNQNISVIDHKEISAVFHRQNSNEISSPVQCVAEVYQAPVDDQIYHEVMYQESSVSHEKNDSPRPEIIEEELYSEIIDHKNSEGNAAVNIYSFVKKGT